MKFENKRAILTLRKNYGLHHEGSLARSVVIYKEEIAKLKAAPDFNHVTNRQYLEYRRELQKIRRALQKTRETTYIFRVYVKKYKREVDIEWKFYSYPLGSEDHKYHYKEMIKEVVNRAIRQCRTPVEVERVSKFGKHAAMFIGKPKNGRIFAKSGEVLRIYVEKHLKDLYTDKRPVEPKKYIGIELEFCAPIDEQNFAIKLFKRGIHKFAQLKKDGSLRPFVGEQGFELAILLEEGNYKKRLKEIMSVLSEIKAVAKERRAGLHVHIDMRKRNRDVVYNNLVACQYALLSIVDPNRYNNEFCRVVNSRKFPIEFNGSREERYKTINAAAFYKYKTLEIRMHEGSVDFEQIINWVDLLIKIANYPKKFKNNIMKVQTLSNRLTMNKKLKSYIQDRSCFWQVQNEPATRQMREDMPPRRNRIPLAPRQATLRTWDDLVPATTAMINNATRGIDAGLGQAIRDINRTVTTMTQLDFPVANDLGQVPFPDDEETF